VVDYSNSDNWLQEEGAELCSFSATTAVENGVFLEKCDAQNLQNFGEAAVQLQFLFHDRHKHVHADRDPDLGLHRIVGRTVERFDLQMLFDPFEEQFHLPATPVQLGDRREVVRQGVPWNPA